MPAKGFRPNFKNKIIKRELRALYDNIGVNSASDDNGCNLNSDDFSGGFTLFCFDLTPDKCNGFHFHENRSGSIDVEVLFEKPLEQAITVLCYTAYERIVGITNERSVIVN